MNFPKARLFVAAVLFLGWITYLFVLAIRSPTIIVSRPQLLVSSLYVEAELRDERGHPDPQVKIVKLLWPTDDADKKLLLNQTIDIPELLSFGKAQGYRGAGAYILPLSRLANPVLGEFAITPVPRVPDIFPPRDRLATVELLSVPLRAEVLATLVGLLAAPTEPIPYSIPTAWTAAVKANEQPVVRCLLEYGRLSPHDAEALAGLARKPGFGRFTVTRGWPIDEALQLRKHLQEAGALARVTEVDVQIYPAVPQVLSQVEEMIASKK